MKKLLLLLCIISSLHGVETTYSMRQQLIFKDSKEKGAVVVGYSPTTKKVYTLSGVDEPQLSNFYHYQLWVKRHNDTFKPYNESVHGKLSLIERQYVIECESGNGYCSDKYGIKSAFIYAGEYEPVPLQLPAVLITGCISGADGQLSTLIGTNKQITLPAPTYTKSYILMSFSLGIVFGAYLRGKLGH
jgi:hypothetical protein